MPKGVELSVVILCFRSGTAIIDFIKRTEDLVQSLTDSYELVLVANYMKDSTDKTRQYVKQIGEENNKCVVLCKEKEGMMGWDMRAGLEAATGEYICVIDGDGQFPIDSIADCYREIKTGKYDLVKTYRTKREDGINRVIVSKIYNVLFGLLFPGIGTKDANSKPKMLTRTAYQKMNLASDDWFIDAEIMLNARELGMKFHEIPIEFYSLHGRSSFVKTQAITEFIRNLLLYRFGKRPQKR